jgi:hypothetical protein
MSDLVLMDRTYKEKIQMRRQLINTQEDHVVGFHPVAAEAVTELYLHLFGTYLPRRYPTMLRLEDTHRYDLKQQTVVRNLVFDEEISLIPPEPKECLRVIGRHVDNEFALLLPTSNAQAAPFRAEPEATVKEPYHLHAFILTFPSGFDPSKKLGLPLADTSTNSRRVDGLTMQSIHGPAPGYSVKLEKSMDRFFATLPFGKII